MGKDTRERTPRTRHPGQVTWAKKTVKGRAEHANLFKFYPPFFTDLIPTKIFIHTGIFQPPLSKTPHKNLKN
jgi:hypothetical protein